MLMEQIRIYLIRVTVAALVSGLALHLCTNGAVKRIVRLCSGLCLTLVVLSPLLQVDSSALLRQFQALERDAAQWNQTGQSFTSAQMADIISQQTEAYILDKAAACQAQIRVEVETEPLGVYYSQPSRVILSGQVSAQQQLQLTQILIQDLGLTEEQIQWENETQPGKN